MVRVTAGRRRGSASKEMRAADDVTEANLATASGALHSRVPADQAGPAAPSVTGRHSG